MVDTRKGWRLYGTRNFRSVHLRKSCKAFNYGKIGKKHWQNTMVAVLSEDFKNVLNIYIGAK